MRVGRLETWFIPGSVPSIVVTLVETLAVEELVLVDSGTLLDVEPLKLVVGSDSETLDAEVALAMAASIIKDYSKVCQVRALAP